VRRSLALLLVVPLVVGLLAAVGASPAQARPVPQRADPHDAPYPIDTRLVRLFPRLKDYVTIQAYSRTYRAGPRFNGMDVYYDTRGGLAADYRLLWAFGGDGDGFKRFQLLRVNGTDVVSTVDCPGISAKGRKRIRAIEAYVPRSCLTIRKKIGVKVITWDFKRYRRGTPVRGVSDVVPNRGWLR
jgi:hypothetical protein